MSFDIVTEVGTLSILEVKPPISFKGSKMIHLRVENEFQACQMSHNNKKGVFE